MVLVAASFTSHLAGVGLALLGLVGLPIAWPMFRTAIRARRLLAMAVTGLLVYLAVMCVVLGTKQAITGSS